jgi:hypothetical protein
MIAYESWMREETMFDYRIPKFEARVVVTPVFGETHEATLWLGETSAAHSGTETVSELLNSGRPFVPFNEHGRLNLLRRDAIRWVEVPDAGRLEWRFWEIQPSATRLPVECVFSDTDRLQGTFFAIGPASERRVSDVVRDLQFTHLENPSGLFLVNLHQVTLIRVLDEP